MYVLIYLFALFALGGTGDHLPMVHGMDTISSHQLYGCVGGWKPKPPGYHVGLSFCQG